MAVASFFPDLPDSLSAWWVLVTYGPQSAETCHPAIAHQQASTAGRYVRNMKAMFENMAKMAPSSPQVDRPQEVLAESITMPRARHSERDCRRVWTSWSAICKCWQHPSTISCHWHAEAVSIFSLGIVTCQQLCFFLLATYTCVYMVLMK